MRPTFQTACVLLKRAGLYHTSWRACTALPTAGLQVDKQHSVPSLSNPNGHNHRYRSGAAEQEP